MQVKISSNPGDTSFYETTQDRYQVIAASVNHSAKLAQFLTAVDTRTVPVIGASNSTSWNSEVQEGMSQLDISETLGVSRGAVIRHLDADGSNSTKAQTGEVPTGSREPNRTKVPTGSPLILNAPDGALEPSDASGETRSRSCCVPFHQVILDKLTLGLVSQRIYQDLVCEHGFQDKYWSVVRYVKGLGTGT